MADAVTPPSLWDRLTILVAGAFGFFLVISWAIFPVPTRQDLTEVSGILASYSIEGDQSWFARHGRGRPTVYVLFKITDHPGRFWSDAVDPGNVRSIFPHPGVALNFYHRSTLGTSGLINGDGEKTYGLTVDGAQVQSVDDAVGHDAVHAHYVLPGLGLLMLALAGYWWRNPRRRTAHP